MAVPRTVVIPRSESRSDRSILSLRPVKSSCIVRACEVSLNPFSPLHACHFWRYKLAVRTCTPKVVRTMLRNRITCIYKVLSCTTKTTTRRTSMCRFLKLRRRYQKPTASSPQAQCPHWWQHRQLASSGWILHQVWSISADFDGARHRTHLPPSNLNFF